MPAEVISRFRDQQGRKLQLLEDFLDHQAGEHAMTLEELDGFFAALHCCSEIVPPSEYLPVIFGEDSFESGELFLSVEHANLILGLIMDHWNAVGSAFREGEFFWPLLLADEEQKIHGNEWAIGFLRGTCLRKEYWLPLLDDDNRAGPFVAIFALAHENDPDPELRPYKEPVSPELREELLAALCAGVTHLYRYFGPHRKKIAAEHRDQATFRRTEPRIGRNDLCYCGSGKKYKKCCYTAKPN